MGWVDPQWIPVLQRDGRYVRLLNMTRRFVEERERAVSKCSCTGGQTTVKDADGNEATVPCDGSWELPTYSGHEDNG